MSPCNLYYAPDAVYKCNLFNISAVKTSATPNSGNLKEKMSCPVCKVAIVRRGFRRHYETMHCAQDPVSCQFCQKSFKHRYSLDCHQRQAHPNMKKKQPKKNENLFENKVFAC